MPTQFEITSKTHTHTQKNAVDIERRENLIIKDEKFIQV